tara:strand:+ start:201 stop:416 length:216 start_codon:yes stop_codon:yes gene_type:complete
MSKAQELMVSLEAKADKLDRDIEKAWYKQGFGVQINIMNIPKVFREVRAAVQGGQSIKDGVADAIKKYREN